MYGDVGGYIKIYKDVWLHVRMTLEQHSVSFRMRDLKAQKHSTRNLGPQRS